MYIQNRFYASLASFNHKTQIMDKDGFIIQKDNSLELSFSTQKFIVKQYFIQTISKHLQINTEYYMLVRVHMGTELYKMIHKQLCFIYKSPDQLYLL